MKTEVMERRTPRLLIPGVIALLVLALLGTLGGSERASAGLSWCWGDPVIHINGRPVSVSVGVLDTDVTRVEEAVVTFHVPKNATADVLYVATTPFKERAIIVKDQPNWDGKGDLKVPVDVYVKTKDGSRFDIQVQTMTLYSGTKVSSGQAGRTAKVTTYLAGSSSIAKMFN